MTPKSRDQELLETQGYVVCEQLFDPAADIAPVLREYEGILDRVAKRLHAEGKLPSLYADLPFGQRLVAMHGSAKESFFQDLDLNLPNTPLVPISERTGGNWGPAVFSLLSHTKLLDKLEELMGPEIGLSPRNHVRLKVPMKSGVSDFKNFRENVDGRRDIYATTAWHQDGTGEWPGAEPLKVTSVWMAMTHANLETGCLSVIPGSHKGRVFNHVPIADEDMPKERVPLICKPGDVVIFHRNLLHGSIDNRSQDVRFSIDCRFFAIPADHPIPEHQSWIHAPDRPWYPGFALRSRRAPDRVLKDHNVWRKCWEETRTHLALKAEPLPGCPGMLDLELHRLRTKWSTAKNVFLDLPSR